MAGNNPLATDIDKVKASTGGAIADSGSPAGTTGQVMTKLSNAPDDYGWASIPTATDTTLRYSHASDGPYLDSLRKYHPIDISAIVDSVAGTMMNDRVTPLEDRVSALETGGGSGSGESSPVDLTPYLRKDRNDSVTGILNFQNGFLTKSISPTETTQADIEVLCSLRLSGIGRYFKGGTFVGTNGFYTAGGSAAATGYIDVIGATASDALSAKAVLNVLEVLPRNISKTSPEATYRTSLGSTSLPFKKVFADAMQVNGKELLDTAGSLINPALLPTAAAYTPTFATLADAESGTGTGILNAEILKALMTTHYDTYTVPSTATTASHGVYPNNLAAYTGGFVIHGGYFQLGSVLINYGIVTYNLNADITNFGVNLEWPLFKPFAVGNNYATYATAIRTAGDVSTATTKQKAGYASEMLWNSRTNRLFYIATSKDDGMEYYPKGFSFIAIGKA